MNHSYQIIPFNYESHRDAVIALWVRVFGYETAHNEPNLVIKKKQDMGDGLFFVYATEEGHISGTVMCGYDGHRGWIYSLAVSPELHRNGVGTALMNHAETALESRGCMKVNLQVMEGNEKVQAFYETIGYRLEKRVSLGKRITSNIPGHDNEAGE